MISMGSFSTDRLQRGRFLGVDRIVTLDKRMLERFSHRQVEIQGSFGKMIVTLAAPFQRAKLPIIYTSETFQNAL